MTWITDGSGTRWVEIPRRKQRKSPRALRFADLQVGDQLICKRLEYRGRQSASHYLVTDMWFDPVAGQDDPTAGRMVAVVRIAEDGIPTGHKASHTLRGLASQGYRYAEVDYIALCYARAAEGSAGKVVGIRMGEVFRLRPKTPGGGL